MKRKIADNIVKIARKPPFSKLLFRVGRSQGIIFMLHRFDLTPFGINGIRGHDVGFLEQCLVELKESGHSLVSVDDMVKAAREGKTIDNAVAFTIDDGFFDHGVVAEKIFAKHQIPVTIFLVTDFVDGDYWMLESRIEYLIRKAELKEYGLKCGEKEFDGVSERALIRQLIWHSKTLTLSAGEDFLANMAEQLNIDIPVKPPENFRPISWEEAQRLESLGITFGAHTARHPTLSLEADKDAEEQIKRSMTRIKQKLTKPSSVFCYPTGRTEDFSEREQNLLSSLASLGALSTTPGYVRGGRHFDSTVRYKIPRFSWPENATDFGQTVYYLESLKATLHI